MEDATNIVYDTLPEMCGLRVLDYDSIYSRREHLPATHELLYVLDGRIALHFSGGLTFRAVPGDFLLVPAGTAHRDGFVRVKGLRIMIIQFSWDNDTYFRIVNNHTLGKLSYEVRTECRRRLEFMRGHWHNNGEDKRHGSIELHGILMLFYRDLLNLGGGVIPATVVPMQETMRRAKHFIEQNFMDQIGLKQTAGHVGISPAYLSRFFHREYGIGFAEYLTAVRLSAAVELLQGSNLQVEEAAIRCGFSSGSYFIRVFKKHYGVTPKKYAGEKRV